MHQDSPVVIETELTPMGRKRKSVEVTFRRKLARAYSNGKESPDARNRTITRAEFREAQQQHKSEMATRATREETRLRRLLYLWGGRREMKLRIFDDGSHKCREVDQTVFVPYLFSFELWLLEERCGCRESKMRPDEFRRCWEWWLDLSWREQLDEMLMRRDAR